jgi:hypothetical protein
MPADRFKINKPKVIHEIFDDEVVIINLNSGNYYSLQNAGARIWELIEREAMRDEIVAEIVARYDGTRDEIARAVNVLLEEFAQEDLIAPATGERGAEMSAASLSPAGEPRIAFEPPVLNKYTDMEDLLLLDPIHEVDEMGWPHAKEDGQK